MRRNPRPYKSSFDRRRLAIEIIEREARAAPLSSQIAIETARDPELLPRDLPTLRLPKR